MSAPDELRTDRLVLRRPSPDDLVSFTLPFNAPSRRVMEKLGFAYEKDCWYKDLPHVLYRLCGSGAAPPAT